METVNIKKELNKIEEKKDIKILFAIESGSRAWGMHSKDSDYDVRFVYIRPEVNDYLRINKLPEVIEHQEDDMDCLGFDIFKFTKLLLNSNPSVIEWLNSDIIYIDDEETKELFRKYIEEHFNPLALYHHYRSMCKQNYLKYLKTNLMMTHKKYLYCMRGLVNAKYVENYKSIPPISFNNTINTISGLANEDVMDKIKEIIQLKKEGFKQIKVSKIHLFESYIEEFIKETKEIESRRLMDYSKIQKYIWKIIK